MKLRTRLGVLLGTLIIVLAGTAVAAAPAQASAGCAHPGTGRLCIYNNTNFGDPEIWYWTSGSLWHGKCTVLSSSINNVMKSARSGLQSYAITFYTSSSCGGSPIVNLWTWDYQSCNNGWFGPYWDYGVSPCAAPTASSFLATSIA